VRILLASYADSSYFFGMVPAAWALRAAGHEVRVACQPALTEAAVDTGLTVVPVGRDHMLSAAADGDTPPLSLSADGLARLGWAELSAAYSGLVMWWWKPINEPLLADLVAFAREWRPDLVLWEPTTFAGAVAAEAVGAAHARFLWSVDLPGRLRAAFLRAAADRPPHERADPAEEWLTACAARHGVPFSEELVRGRFAVTQLPASLRGDVAGPAPLAVRHVPYAGHAVLPRWLRTPPERRRILVDWRAWSAGGDASGRALLDTVLAGAAGVDAEVVLALPDEGVRGPYPVPEGVLTIGPGAYYAVVPTCAAVVHLGGFDTYCTALLHGVPQLIAPEPGLLDAALLAGALRDARGGDVLPADGTPEGVRAALERLLGDAAVAEGVALLRKEVGELPAPDALVPALEEAAAAHRPAARG
jgi:hypothetical protein